MFVPNSFGDDRKTPHPLASGIFVAAAEPALSDVEWISGGSYFALSLPPRKALG
jgi:hypothetical protein